MESWVLFIVVCLVLFSLPDMLRRRNKYPRHGPAGKPLPPIAGKPGKIELPRRKVSVQAPASPAEVKEKMQPLPDTEPAAEPPVGPLPQTSSQPSVPERQTELPVGDSLKEGTTFLPAPPVQETPLILTRVVHRRPHLNQAARQIYGGIIWSELLQPPLSRRKR